MGNVFCINCGVANPEHANYCFSCGKHLARSIGVNASIPKTISSRTTSPQSPSVMDDSLATKIYNDVHLPPLEIRRKSFRNCTLMILGCSVFTIGGALTLASGDPKTMFVGLLAVVFFGGGGIYSVPKIVRRKISFVVTEDGLQQIAPVGSAYITWNNVEKIGISKLYGNRFVGIWLKTYDQYIAGISPDMVDYFRSRLPVMKVLTRTASLLEMPYSELFKIWSVMSGAEEPADILKSFGKVGTYVEALLWNREHSGYDLLWGWSDRDRNAMEFVKLLERYRVSRAT